MFIVSQLRRQAKIQNSIMMLESMGARAREQRDIISIKVLVPSPAGQNN